MLVSTYESTWHQNGKQRRGQLMLLLSHLKCVVHNCETCEEEDCLSTVLCSWKISCSAVFEVQEFSSGSHFATSL
jgi:hypothetical protein